MMDFYRVDLGEIYKELGSGEKGLSASEAKARLEKYGYNRIEGKKGINPFILFLQQFNDPVIWVLIGAAIISGILGETIDLYVNVLRCKTEQLVANSATDNQCTTTGISYRGGNTNDLFSLHRDPRLPAL